MSIKKEFSFLSACKTTSIHAVSYVPDGPVKGILQITHGMVEYIERYEEFADYLIEWIVSKCDMEFDRQTEFHIIRMIVDAVKLYEKEVRNDY